MPRFPIQAGPVWSGTEAAAARQLNQEKASQSQPGDAFYR